MRILISNDDGVHAPGIKILYEVLKSMGAEVKVVAPLEEMSTTGHSLTISKPLRLVQMDKNFFGVNGSPADCVQVALSQVFKRKPDIVVSGINRGANLGQDVYYSGTVSAAREACMMGIPALAVSLNIDFYNPQAENKLHYEAAGVMAKRVIQQFLIASRRGAPNHLGDLALPYHTLLNLNVPDLPLAKIKGIQLARQGFRFYSAEILKRRDHRGKDYYWVGGGYKGYRAEAGTDCDVVDRDYASLTPLRLDCTNHEYMLELQKLWGKTEIGRTPSKGARKKGVKRK